MCSLNRCCTLPTPNASCSTEAMRSCCGGSRQMIRPTLMTPVSILGAPAVTTPTYYYYYYFLFWFILYIYYSDFDLFFLFIISFYLLLWFIIIIDSFIILFMHTKHIIYARWASDFTQHNSKHTAHTKNTLFMLVGPGLQPLLHSTQQNTDNTNKNTTHIVMLGGPGATPPTSHYTTPTSHNSIQPLFNTTQQ
jgi:hypothetical protein